MTPPTAPTPMDLSEQGLRERLTRLVMVEPDGEAWRVTLVYGIQRSSIIRLSVREACEAYAAWIREKILLPEFLALRDAARAEQREARMLYNEAVTILLECAHGDEQTCGCKDRALERLATIRAQGVSHE